MPAPPSYSKEALEALLDPRSVQVDELSLSIEGRAEPIDMVQVVDALVQETLVRRSVHEPNVPARTTTRITKHDETTYNAFVEVTIILNYLLNGLLLV